MDFVNASATGARLGLERAGQTIGQQEAAQRLGLGYAQLGANENESAQRIAAERENAAASLAQHMQSLQSTEANRQSEAANRVSEEAHRTAAEALAEKHQSFLEDQAKQKAEEAKAEKYFHVGGGLYKHNPATGKVDTIVPPGQKYDQLDLMNLKTAHSRLNEARKALAQASSDTDKAAAQKLVDDNQKEVTSLEKKMRSGGAASSLSGDDFFNMNMNPDDTVAPSPAAASVGGGEFPPSIKVLNIEPAQ